MAETNANWVSGREHDVGRLRIIATTLAKALAVGVLGGVATFVYTRADLMTVNLDPQLVLGFVALAGVFVHMLTATLRESIRFCLVAFIIGGIVLVGVWVAPLWILPYSPAARDVLLPKLVGEAVIGGFLATYSVVFLGAYLTAVCVDAVRV